MNNPKSKQKIKIAGAGLSGLATGINLQKRDYKVTICERLKKKGSRFNNDFQGIANWLSDKDVLELLENMNLKPDTPFFPTRQATFFGPDFENKVEFNSEAPIFYLVRRGLKEGCLDKALREKFLESGGKIKFGTYADRDKVDIVATGPEQAKGIASGYTFDTNFKDSTYTIIDDNLAPKGYAYLLIKNGHGTIATALFRDFNSKDASLQRTEKAFKSKLGLRFNNKEKFTGYVDFSLKKKLVQNGKLYVGEAAGLQDYFLGFGIYFALRSGYLAAKSIDKGLDYSKICKQDLYGFLKASAGNRFLFELLGPQMYNDLIRRCKNYENSPQKLFKKVYDYGLISRISYPLGRLF